MSHVVLMGAAGKMGLRIGNSLRESPYTLSYVEVSKAGIAALAERGVTVTPQAEAVPRADIVVLAVPDRLIRGIAADLVPQLRDGALLVLLDPAAAYLEHLPPTDRVAYFVVHPCHPPLFYEQQTPAARADYFGLGLAEQSIVCSLVQGDEEDYRRGEALARAMFGPILRSHRISVEEMAICEAIMGEAIAITMLLQIRKGLEEAIARGVPEEAARDFLLGHLQVELAIAFGAIDTDFSDAAKVAAQVGERRLIRPGLERFFEPATIGEIIKIMLDPERLENDDG